MGFPGGASGKEPTCQCGRVLGLTPGLGRFPGGEHGKNSSILAWRIPWTEEPGGLQSIRQQKVGHGCCYLAHTQLWRLRSPTICCLQAPGKLAL